MSGWAGAERVASPWSSVELWRFNLAEPVNDSARQWLSASERARAAQFRFARHRNRYVASRCFLRHLLALRLGQPADALTFRVGEFGKPELATAPGCQFNLSHCEDAALVAVGDAQPLGVDLELSRHVADALMLAERHFTAREAASVRAAGPALQDTAFLRLWTGKEACLKALGNGLSIEPSGFELPAQDRAARAQIPTAGASVASVEVDWLELGVGWVGAVARVVDC